MFDKLHELKVFDFRARVELLLFHEVGRLVEKGVFLLLKFLYLYFNIIFRKFDDD